MIVDVHNHYYPPAYLDALRSGESMPVTITLPGVEPGTKTC